MSLKTLRLACSAVFVVCVPGMIVSSIAGNNEGFVVTFGMFIAGAALILLAVSATQRGQRTDVFSDALAEKVEGRIAELVRQGASEETARALVRDTISLVRGHS